jgi:hypothetical protein
MLPSRRQAAVLGWSAQIEGTSMLKPDPNRPDLGPFNIGAKSIGPMYDDDNFSGADRHEH